MRRRVRVDARNGTVVHKDRRRWLAADGQRQRQQTSPTRGIVGVGALFDVVADFPTQRAPTSTDRWRGNAAGSYGKWPGTWHRLRAVTGRGGDLWRARWRQRRERGRNDGWNVDVPLFVLDQNAVAQLERSGKPRLVTKVGLGKEARDEPVAEDGMKYLGHLGLLLKRTVVLHRQDHRVRRLDEGAALDCLHYRSERYLGRQRMTVINDRLAVIAVPTIQFHTATSRQ